MKYTDKEIIQAIQDGRNDKVIASLYSTLLPLIVKYIKANRGNADDAFDIFQDALINFVRIVKEKKFEGGNVKIHPYIFTIAKNLWTNKAIKLQLGSKWEKTKISEEEEELILGKIISEERIKILELVFHSIGEKCIELLKLFYYHELSMKEIAEKLNLQSADVTKLKVFRCKRVLIEKVKANNYILEQLKKG